MTTLHRLLPPVTALEWAQANYPQYRFAWNPDRGMVEYFRGTDTTPYNTTDRHLLSQFENGYRMRPNTLVHPNPAHNHGPTE